MIIDSPVSYILICYNIFRACVFVEQLATEQGAIIDETIINKTIIDEKQLYLNTISIIN